MVCETSQFDERFPWSEKLIRWHTGQAHSKGTNEWAKRKKIVPDLIVTSCQYGESYGHVEKEDKIFGRQIEVVYNDG